MPLPVEVQLLLVGQDGLEDLELSLKLLLVALCGLGLLRAAGAPGVPMLEPLDLDPLLADLVPEVVAERVGVPAAVCH